ncbi:MAG: hypothetical protein ACOC8P_00255 [Dichotomicrobium sp.]
MSRQISLILVIIAAVLAGCASTDTREADWVAMEQAARPGSIPWPRSVRPTCAW